MFLICERFRRCIFTSNTDGTYALSVSIFTNNLDAWHIIVGNPCHGKSYISSRVTIGQLAEHLSF